MWSVARACVLFAAAASTRREVELIGTVFGAPFNPAVAARHEALAVNESVPDALLQELEDVSSDVVRHASVVGKARA